MKILGWTLLLFAIAGIIIMIFSGGCVGLGTQQAQKLEDKFDQRSKEQEELINKLKTSVDTDRKEVSKRMQNIEGVQGDLSTSVSEIRNEQTNYVTKTQLEQTKIDIKKTTNTTIKESSQKSENEGWVIITCVAILTVAVLFLFGVAAIFMFRLLKALIKGSSSLFG